MTDLRTRFAPSPTGRLHLGHALSAGRVRQMAEATGASHGLRIEDIDPARCKPEYTAAIHEDLAWLGLEYDQPIVIQSQRFRAYEAVLDRLIQLGVTYKCFRTRQDLRALQSPLTPGALPADQERMRLDAGDAFAVRLNLSAARDHLGDRYDTLAFTDISSNKTRVIPARPDLFGDVTLKRKDSPTSYHIACTHDDYDAGITHIVRGEDLRDVTHTHVLLQALLGWPSPAYAFHPLILRGDGQKLAKRDADKSLAAWRAEGVTADEIWRMTGLART